MGICKKCGQPLQDGQRICNICGTENDFGMQAGDQTAKQSSKKGMIIGVISVAAIVAVVLVMALVVLPGRKAGEKASEKKVKEYFEYINDLEVEKIADATISRALLKKLILGYGDVDAEEKAQFENEYDDEYEAMLKSLQDNVDSADIKVECTNIKIGDIEKADIKKLIEDSLGVLDSDEYDVDELYDKFVEACSKCGIDVDDIYEVGVDFDCKVSINGESGSKGVDIGTMVQAYVNHMYTYVYDGETYVVPGLETLLMPSLSRYVGKSRKSYDVTGAQTIKTVIETVMGNEQIYDALTQNTGGYSIITLREGELADKDNISLKNAYGDIIQCELLVDYMSDYFANGTFPSIRYKDYGSKNWIIIVTDKAEVYVGMDGDGFGESSMDVPNEAAANINYLLSPYLCDEFSN